MTRYLPLRKVMAAVLTALIGTPAFIIWLQDASPTLATVLAAAVPVLVAWLTPNAATPPGGSNVEVTGLPVGHTD